MITKGERSATTLLLLLLVCIISSQLAYAADNSKCSSSLFYCPNCNGVEVTDCFDCDGYLSTDAAHEICFDRRLFQPYNIDPSDPDDHYHYLWNDLVGAFVWFLTAGVATACGVGGGGIYVPLGILLLRFAPKQASGLSQASIFGASLGGIILNGRNRHPNKKIRHDPGAPDDKGRLLQKQLNPKEEEEYLEQGGKFYTRPLINYDMALFLAPMEMAGAVLGVLVQKILPNWLYLLIAGLVLSITAYKTYQKFFAVRKKEKDLENEAEQKKDEEEEVSETLEKITLDDAAADSNAASDAVQLESVEVEVIEEGSSTPSKSHECSDDKTLGTQQESTATSDNLHEADGQGNECIGTDRENRNHVKGNGLADDDSPEYEDDDADFELRQQYLEEDMRQYPREKIAALIVLWIGLFLLTLMKGGKGVESLVGVTCDSPWYAVLIAVQFLWMFGFAIWFGRELVRKQAARKKVHYPYLANDPVWDAKSLRFYGIFTFLAGVVAGLIGIGGGMVLGPLMLVMGIDPRVSTATTATMIVLTSSSVAVIFVTSGIVPWSYAVFYFLICFCGAILGKLKIDGYVKRTGRASILIFILATIITLATIGCFVILLTRLAEKDWCLDGFNRFCNTDTKDSCPSDRFLQVASSSFALY